MDENAQLGLFNEAVALLGGAAATARVIGRTEAAVRDLGAGHAALDSTILEALSRALIDHATACRALERRVSPAFAENRTIAQRAP
jgi:hypothetical protein